GWVPPAAPRRAPAPPGGAPRSAGTPTAPRRGRRSPAPRPQRTPGFPRACAASAHLPSSGALEDPLTLHPADPQPEALVPALPAQLLGLLVLHFTAPGPHRLQARPVGHRDPHPVLAPGALDAQEARLLCRQLDHAGAHPGIAVRVLRRAHRAEQDG